MKPHQIISLMKFEGADNTLSMADHATTSTSASSPQYGTNSKLAKQLNAVLKPEPVEPPDRAPRQDREPDRAGARRPKAALKVNDRTDR